MRDRRREREIKRYNTPSPFFTGDTYKEEKRERKRLRDRRRKRDKEIQHTFPVLHRGHL